MRVDIVFEDTPEGLVNFRGSHTHDELMLRHRGEGDPLSPAEQYALLAYEGLAFALEGPAHT